MKQSLLILLLLPLICNSQVPFWTEDFGTGCNQAQGVGAYLGPNGTWTVTSTGSNIGSSNQWYISAMENGNAEGECGTGCGNDRTLHVGNTTINTIFIDIEADNGASYYEGLAGFCGLIPCASTDKRVESPVINMTDYTDVTVSFLYIEGGNTIDNATLWYYNGASWGQLADMGKTFSSVCTPQGVWTAFTFALPPTANNNPNVKIGFRWINNDNGDATDPSFAVDDIVISGTDANTDTEPPLLVCSDDISLELGSSCDVVLPDLISGITVTDNMDPAPAITQIPAPGTTISSETIVTFTAIDASGNTSECFIVVSPLDITPPELECPADTTLETAPGATNVYLNFEVPITSDNCGIISVINDYTLTDNATANYSVGTTIVTYTTTDASGNNTSCSFNVTIVAVECCLADYNCDGIVNISDLLFFMGEFGTQSAAADLTSDGSVNVSDLLMFMGQFGLSCN